MIRRVFLVFLVYGVAACGDDGEGPDLIACTDDTGAVEVSVTTGASVRFDWEPACAMAFLIVEQQGGADVWVIGKDPPGTLGPGEPDQVNLITPPVTYGAAPSMADEIYPPETLVAGVTYVLGLGRSPPGSIAECPGVVFGICLMAGQEFVR